MAIATVTLREALAVAYGQNCTHASLHTASPGSTGASEVTGGSYARKAVSWTPGASDGQNVGTATFDVPAGTTVTHVGLWSAVTAGTFLDGFAVTSQNFATAGTYTPTITYTQS